MNALLNIIFPPHCALCGEILPRSESYICPECRAKLPRIKPPRCRICSAPLASEFALPECADCREGVPYNKCYAPFAYKDGIKSAILRMKYGNRASSFRYFAREIAAELGGKRFDFITFVPQNRKTHRKRGYNQTELIARELGKLLKLPVKSTLRRSEKGEKQVSLTKAARLNNARRLYSAKKLKLEGSCLIIDDVITTGATMKACCRLLRKMGCSEVYGAAIAKTIL